MENPDARRGHVLVIDDEASLCTVIRRTLGSEHEVVTVTSARQALELFDGGERYDIVLCDLMMPQMSGFDLAKSVIEMRPEIKVLYMSGYTDNRVSVSWVLESSVPFLHKPFTAAGLTQKVREVLGTEAPQASRL